MSGSATVHVEGITHDTTQKEVVDFFSFCGKISNVSLSPISKDANSAQSATVTFEKENAAKTALLLDNTQLGKSLVTVKPAPGLSELAGSAPTEKTEEGEAHDIAQEDKPRSRIIAEYLAHGYVIGDQVIAKALDLDQQHGVSNRFTKALADFDSKYKVADKTKAADDKLGVSKTATSAWGGFASYFDQGLSTQTGQKLRKFYDVGSKQVLDVRNEARHLANLKSGKPTDSTPASAAPVEQSTTAPAASAPNTGVIPLTEEKH